MAKRPLGLNKANKSKKKKLDGEEKPEKAATKEISPENDDSEPAPQLTLDADEEDDMGQLESLYTNWTSSERDSPRLLHGVIHECDSLLQKAKGEGLPARFHEIYGASLLDLAGFAEKKKPVKKKKVKSEDVAAETSDMFVDAALERVETGLEQYPEDAGLLFVKSRALKQDIDEKMSAVANDERKATAKKMIAQLNAILEVFKQAQKHASTVTPDQLDVVEELIELSGALQGVVKMSDIADTTLVACEKLYNEILESEKDEKTVQKAHRGVGTCKMIIADSLLDLLDEDDEDNDDTVKLAKKNLKSAIEHFQKSETDEDGEFMVTLAETMIQYGNLFETESEEQKKWYGEAVKRLRQAQRMGVGKYDEMILELEDD
ncbi:Enhancer of translation termination 1 [Yarrowia sp. B02]|nr:Enhancer of translation termination 1 [Yarrowia sp. B02]